MYKLKDQNEKQKMAILNYSQFLPKLNEHTEEHRGEPQTGNVEKLET